MDFASDTLRHDVTWQVDEHTYAYLKVNEGTDLDSVLALAADFDFVDWATFAARYGIQPPEVPGRDVRPGLSSPGPSRCRAGPRCARARCAGRSASRRPSRCAMPTA